MFLLNFCLFFLSHLLSFFSPSPPLLPFPLAFFLLSCLLLIALFSFYVPTPADSFLFSFRPSSFHSLHFLYLFFGQNVSFHQHSSQSQKVQERLKELEQEVSGGATAVVALILNNKLYIANVGTNRALLCKSSSDGQNQVLQIGRPHSTDNEDELQRLAALGLDSARIRQAGQIAGQSSTRRLGDYRVKFNYNEIDLISAAKTRPVIAEPEIHGSQSLDNVTGFLLLMSEGLINALESAHGPEQANQFFISS